MSDEKSLSPIRLDPKDVLTFTITLQTPSQTSINIFNTTENEYLTFKVKTTRPMRYLVRPNQGLIGPKGSATIIVILQQKDCAELMQLDMDEQLRLQDKFLVQAALVDSEFASSVANKTPKEVTDALTAKWATLNRNDIFSKKLKCQFITPQTKVQEEGVPLATPSMNSSTAQMKKKSVVFQDDQTIPSATSAGPNKSPSDVATGDSIQEVANLRKKYDELVAFTVRLTSQRDSLITELDKARTQLKKKSTTSEEETTTATTGLRQRRGVGSSSTVTSSSPESNLIKPQGQKGQFQLMHLILAAIAFYFIGRFYG